MTPSSLSLSLSICRPTAFSFLQSCFRPHFIRSVFRYELSFGSKGLIWGFTIRLSDKVHPCVLGLYGRVFPFPSSGRFPSEIARFGFLWIFFCLWVSCEHCFLSCPLLRTGRVQPPLLRSLLQLFLFVFPRGPLPEGYIDLHPVLISCSLPFLLRGPFLYWSSVPSKLPLDPSL